MSKKEIYAKYSKILGSAVNPILREKVTQTAERLWRLKIMLSQSAFNGGLESSVTNSCSAYAQWRFLLS